MTDPGLEWTTIEISNHDLRVLLHWASVGVRYSNYKTSYNLQIENILECYSHHIGYVLSPKPIWGANRRKQKA